MKVIFSYVDVGVDIKFQKSCGLPSEKARDDFFGNRFRLFRRISFLRLLSRNSTLRNSDEKYSVAAFTVMRTLRTMNAVKKKRNYF